MSARAGRGAWTGAHGPDNPGMPRNPRRSQSCRHGGSRRTHQDDTAAARWSLGRGNVLVPWSWQMTLTRAGDNPRPAACRPSAARVLSPRHSRHPSGAASYEASVKGSRSSPARPSPHPWPPDDSGNPPAFPPGSAPTRTGPAHARRGRDRLRAQARNNAASTTSCWPSNQRGSLATCATSCRTHHLAHPGNRKALPRARRRLLHRPPGPRTRNPPAHHQARSPRTHRHPRPPPPDSHPQEPGSASAPPGAAACPAEDHSRIRCRGTGGQRGSGGHGHLPAGLRPGREVPAAARALTRASRRQPSQSKRAPSQSLALRLSNVPADSVRLVVLGAEMVGLHISVSSEWIRRCAASGAGAAISVNVSARVVSSGRSSGWINASVCL